jgi:hypothetical protein
MKHIIFFLFISTSVFAQTPRLKFRQIQKDTTQGSIAISNPADSQLVFSRDLYISYGADTFLILGGDTLAATSSIISSVLSDGVTITGDGTTGSELTVDTATVIATKGDLSDYVTIAGTETITGAKTFTSALTQSGGNVNFDSGTLFVDESENRVGIGTNNPISLLDLYKVDTMSANVYRALQLQDILTYSGTGSKYQQSIIASARHLVPTGLSNTIGYLRGMTFDVTTGFGDTLNSGFLNEITGMQFQVGIESSKGNAPTVTNVTGLNIYPFYQAGSVTNLYALKLQNASTGGSVTNYYGVYQEDSNAKNYFNGNMGIATTTPENQLHIEHTSQTVSGTQLTLEGGFNGYGAGINFMSRTSSGGTRVSMAKITADGEGAWNTTASTQDAGLRFFTTLDGTLSERMRINASGNVGIGTTSPSYPLEMGSGAHVTTGGVWTDASDIKLKTNINYIYPYGLEDIMNLKPTMFDYKNGEKNSLGFIAQDIYEIIPEAISSTIDDNGNETMGLKMVSITATLTKAIQEQQSIIESQATEIETLKTLITELSNRLTILENN